MKKFYVFMCLAALVGSLTACDMISGGNDNPAGKKEKLEAPILTFEQKSLTSGELKWEAVPNAESYTLQAQGQDMVVVKEGTTYLMEGLKIGKNKVSCKSNAPKGSDQYLDSNWTEFEFEIKGSFEPKYSDYLGTWEVTPTRIMYWDVFAAEPQDARFEDNEEPLEVIVEELEDLKTNDGTIVKAVTVTGLSRIDLGTQDNPAPCPFVATYNFQSNPRDPETGEFTGEELFKLEVLNQFGITKMDIDENNKDWIVTPLAISEFKNHQRKMGPVTGQYPAIEFLLTNENGDAQVTTKEGQLNGGGSFKVVALEAFILSPDGQRFAGWTIWDQEKEKGPGYYAAPFKATRISRDVKAPAMQRRSSLTKAQVSENIFRTFSAVVTPSLFVK